MIITVTNGFATEALAWNRTRTEEVFVHALDYVGFTILHADVVRDHELCQGNAVDEDDSGGYAVGVGNGLVGEIARGDEYAPVSLRAMQGADETLDLRAADCMPGCITFGLYVNLVKAERVLADHAVQAVIARSAQELG